MPANPRAFPSDQPLVVDFGQILAAGGPPPNNLADGAVPLGYWRWQDLRLFRAGQWDSAGAVHWEDINGDLHWQLDYAGQDRDHNGYGDILRLSYQSAATRFTRPTPDRFIMRGHEHPHDEPPIDFSATLAGLGPGIYMLTSRSWQDACSPHQYMKAFYFEIQPVFLPTPTIVPTSTPQETPQPTAPPTATPTPLPPPPPVPNAQFQISIHSTLDPNSSDRNPTNGVYRSTGNRIAWPAGEVLDFTPRVRMTLSPPAPSYPGYRYQAHITGWSFVSSAGLDTAATDSMGVRGCRGAGHAATGGLHGCAYAYIGGRSLNDSTEPTEVDMASQAHSYWSAIKPTAMRPDVYTAVISPLRSVDLVIEVQIVVEVVNVATGQVVDSDKHIARGTFAVGLVVPRSVK